MDDKTFVLDIEILLNNNTCLNLEMQVLNEGDWILLFLKSARSFMPTI